jgi:hypothetical protein
VKLARDDCSDCQHAGAPTDPGVQVLTLPVIVEVNAVKEMIDTYIDRVDES